MDISHKKGDTFVAQCVYQDAFGNPVDLVSEGITIESAVRSRHNVYPLTVRLLPEPGAFEVRGDTDRWALGSVFWDIKYRQQGLITSSDVVTIRVFQGATP